MGAAPFHATGVWTLRCRITLVPGSWVHVQQSRVCRGGAQMGGGQVCLELAAGLFQRGNPVGVLFGLPDAG
ncbi:hypothetical protein ACIQNV_36900 [Streptomyces hydrogenans]|uniref:hypothetical protein n=1 Tax=Streptomyces hydrogenans TaxID=1873719 RepID=UPI00381D4577